MKMFTICSVILDFNGVFFIIRMVFALYFRARGQESGSEYEHATGNERLEEMNQRYRAETILREKKIQKPMENLTREIGI